MKTTILAVSCFLVLPLFAQNSRPRVVLPPGAPGAAHAPAEENFLEKNITIRLHGTTTTGTDVDLSLTGIGPVFTADQVMNNDTTLTCHYSVSETETGYRVAYSISSRIKIAVQANPDLTNYEFRDVSITGTVLCTVDRPQVLVSNGTKPLQLTITRQAE